MVAPETGALPSLLNITLDEIVSGLDAHHFTSVDLTNACIARVKEVDDVFRAVLEINKDAIPIAQALDEELKRTGRRSPLHGVPILVKDNIVTDDGMETTAGSPALLGAKPPGECSVVTRLRNAGAVILGKANLSEWANFRSVNGSSGWSPRAGQTLGTYYPDSQPSGSSSGSAVATALGLCFASLGTETSGSIVSPAQVNNIVGLKPTRGLIGGDRTIPVSKRQDVIGPMTRTVKDAALMLNAMAGKSDDDPFTWNIPFDKLPDYAKSCEDTNLAGIAIGIPRNTLSEIATPVMAAFESAIASLGGLGANIKDETNIPSAKEHKELCEDEEFFVITAEFKSDLAAYFATLQNNPHKLSSVADLIEFIKTHPEEEYPDRDIERFLRTQNDDSDVTSAKFKEAVEREDRLYRKEGILGVMDELNLDVIAVPANASTPSAAAAALGLPIVTVPLGFYPEGTEVKKTKWDLVETAPGIPFCMTFIGKHYSESVLLKVAHTFEQATSVRKNGPLPYLVPRTELGHAA